MLIRLYSGCRLSQNYDEIFYPKKISNVNVFEAYLETLQYVDIDLDYAYLTRQGMLSFEWDAWADGNVSKYNYMRVSDDELTSYAFITSVNYINGLATVNYAIDIWHTYAPSMTLGDSIMTATRFPRATAPRALPLGYTTNTILNETAYNQIAPLTGRVAAVVQYQYYSLDTQEPDKVTYRNIATAIFNDTTAVYMTYDNLLQGILGLVANSSMLNLETAAGAFYYYEIKSIWIIPEEWAYELIQQLPIGVFDKVVKNVGTESLPIWQTVYALYPLQDKSSYKTYTITASQSMIGVGTHTNATPLNYNGKDHTVRVSMFATNNDFAIDLEVDGGRSSITSDFELDIPIAAASAAETQQAAIAKQLREQQSDARLWQTAFQIIAGAGQVAIGAGAVASGVGAGLGVSQIVSGIGTIGGGLMGVSQINAERNSINAKLYATNAGTRCVKSAAQNASRGLCTLSIDPANAAEVETAIAAEGYSVYYGTSALYPDATVPADATLTTREYDILKYSFARVYGGFPEDVKEALKNILLSGARIWYKIPA